MTSAITSIVIELGKMTLTNDFLKDVKIICDCNAYDNKEPHLSNYMYIQRIQEGLPAETLYDVSILKVPTFV